MKSVGTARRIDQLGRVVIPAELRKLLGIRQGDLLDIRVEDGRLTVIKIDPECALCGSPEELRTLHEKQICRGCVLALVPA